MNGTASEHSLHRSVAFGSPRREVTWLVYPFSNNGQQFVMGEPEIRFTEWEAVLSALREGEPLSRD